MTPHTTVSHHRTSKTRQIFVLLAIAGIATIAGCGGEESASTEEIAAPTNFNFTMANQRSETITDVTIQGMALPVKFNKIKAGSSQTLLAKSMNISDTVTVAWTNSRGDRKEVDLKIIKQIPKRFNGALKFTIKSNGKVDFFAGSAP